MQIEREKKGAERRESERINLNLRLRYKSTENDTWENSECINISSTGAFIRSNNPLEVGTQLNFEIYLSSKGQRKSLEVKGEVVWKGDCEHRIFTHHLGNLTRRVKGMGIRFHEPALEETEDLKDFLKKTSPTKMVNDNPVVKKFKHWFR